MGRIEDDREAYRARERQQLQARKLADQKTEAAKSESAFARAMERTLHETQSAQEHHEQALADVAESEDTQITEALTEQREAADRGSARAKDKAAARGFAGRMQKQSESAAGRSEDARGLQQGQQRTAATQRSRDQQGSDSQAGERGAQAKSGSESLANARGSTVKGDTAAEAKTTADGAPHQRVEKDADQGGGQQKGGEGNQSGQQSLAGSFRFNPALMAPVPVAQPRDLQGNARMRALANEIAQKIVQSVRVGKNALGMAEFQIDLKSSVLSGLSIKLSGNNGKIRALFRGSDKDVLKMLQEQEGALKQALEGRGLRLEEFKVEAKA